MAQLLVIMLCNNVDIIKRYLFLKLKPMEYRIEDIIKLKLADRLKVIEEVICIVDNEDKENILLAVINSKLSVANR